ncbi:MAG: hypothetical protein ACFFCO_06870 [Promethearchaeota archaeon]
MSKGLTTAGGIIYLIEFFTVLSLTPIVAVPLSPPGFEMYLHLFIVVLVLLQLLLYHWALAFGLLSLRWREFPDENKSALLAFGIAGIIMSCCIGLIGGWLDWLGTILGIVASILVIIASATSKEI